MQYVRMWCDNKEYRNKPDGRPNRVLLPYARDHKTTPLVIAATLADGIAAAGATGTGAETSGTSKSSGKAAECVVLFPDFE